jgi:hypothetical protein
MAQEKVLDNPAPQCPEDGHGPKYDNDVSVDNWLRSDGTKRPGFDKDNAWRKGKGL